jgi:hypothetical protein
MPEPEIIYAAVRVSAAVEKPSTRALQSKNPRKNTSKHDGARKVAAFMAGHIQPSFETLSGVDGRRIPRARGRISTNVEERTEPDVLKRGFPTSIGVVWCEDREQVGEKKLNRSEANRHHLSQSSIYLSPLDTT